MVALFAYWKIRSREQSGYELAARRGDGFTLEPVALPFGFDRFTERIFFTASYRLCAWVAQRNSKNPVAARFALTGLLAFGCVFARSQGTAAMLPLSNLAKSQNPSFHTPT